MSTRNTNTRDQHRRAIRRTQPPCAICGRPIDYALHYLDPGAYVVDHVIPLDRGGPDTLDNKQPAHRLCNRLKSNHLEGEQRTRVTPTPLVTSRDWTPGGHPPSDRPPPLTA